MSEADRAEERTGGPAETVQMAPGTYVIRTSGGTLNSGLVIGKTKALVIDTGAGPRQAASIYAAVRQLTKLPLAVVNTHFHAARVFGNAYFAAQGVQDFYAHRNCANDIAEYGTLQREAVAETEPEMAAAEGEYTGIKIPTKIVDSETTVDLGGVEVKLFYLGRGHTDGDLLAGSPTTLFAGALVEQGVPPGFDDSYPRDWLETLRRISGLRGQYDVLVPGHGQAVGYGAGGTLVASMYETMSLAIRTGEQASRDTPADTTKAIPILPYGPVQSRALLQRLKATR